MSVGHVGQLAVDLLISSLDMKQVGFFYLDSVQPMAGNNPFINNNKNSDIVTAMEGIFYNNQARQRGGGLGPPLVLEGGLICY